MGVKRKKNVSVRVDGLMVASGLALGLGIWVWRKKNAVAQAINPVNNENIFHRGVNAVGDVLDDGNRDGSFSLGSKIFDWIHGENHGL